MRSGLPDGLVFWVLPRCREVGSSNGYIYYFHGREVGFTRRFGILGFCHGVVRLVHPTVIYYFHDHEVGLSDGLLVATMS